MLNPLGIVSVSGELVAALRVLPDVLDALREVREDTRRMADNTDTLPEVRDELAKVAELASVLPPMDDRAGIAELVGLMERLGDSLEPLGRLADRVPGASRR